jgi:exonuclease III
MDYWQKTKGNSSEAIEWKNKCIEFLKKEKDVDFYILQEINPLKLFEKTSNQYEFSMTDYSILYHELTNELLFENRKGNFWGNAIFYHNKNKLGNNGIGLIDLYGESKYYYGRNGIMCYEFTLENHESVIIINFYNKKNYAHHGSYEKMLDDFGNDKEIINILEKTDSHIIMAGDFNKGFGDNDKDKYCKFTESYRKYDLASCMQNYSKTFIPTYYHVLNNQFYLNDFCFLKNINVSKILNEKDEWESIGNTKLWKGLSDHRPLILELK